MSANMTTKIILFVLWVHLAYSYATILREVAREFGIELEIIEETPMNGLIEFHSLNIEEP